MIQFSRRHAKLVDRYYPYPLHALRLARLGRRTSPTRDVQNKRACDNPLVAIPQHFIQELLARADVVEIVGRYVQLKKTGANLSGLCPFHSEKSPSFTVNPFTWIVRAL